MNPEDGAIMRLRTPADARPGDQIDPAAALKEGLAADEDSKEKLMEMLERANAAGRDPAPVTLVDESVVQKLRLGEKELRRRKQRRR